MWRCVFFKEILIVFGRCNLSFIFVVMIVNKIGIVWNNRSINNSLFYVVISCELNKLYSDIFWFEKFLSD